MITDPAELAALRESTLTLIESDHIDVALTRSDWQRTAAGGIRKNAVAPLASQTLFFGAVTGDPILIQMPEGNQVQARHVLVGDVDADIQEGDTFMIGARHFKVLDVHPDHSYETRAWVGEKT